MKQKVGIVYSVPYYVYVFMAFHSEVLIFWCYFEVAASFDLGDGGWVHVVFMAEVSECEFTFDTLVF